jgi:hypothetical protein
LIVRTLTPTYWGIKLAARKIKCGVCGYKKFPHDIHTIELTTAEKRALQEPVEKLHYCIPCWKILNDPVRGPVLMKGLVQVWLKTAGHPDAERLATQYYEKLAKKLTAVS